MFLSRKCVALCCTVAIGVISGCENGDEGAVNRPATHPVTGIVLMDGEPVADADVSFRSAGTDPVAATGKTGADGKFTLTSFVGGDGAVEGSHTVTVVKVIYTPGDPTYDCECHENYGEEVPLEAQEKEEYVVPEKYMDFETSGIEVTVAVGGSDLTIKLESK